MTIAARLLTAASLLLTAASGHRDAASSRSHEARPYPFEIASNKPFVQVTVNGSAPQWFILDSGCAEGSVIAKECADRLGLERRDETQQHLGAGAGVAVGVATTSGVTLSVAGDTLRAPEFRVFTLAHVAPYEGRRVDGLLGDDFLSRHVVEIDYAHRGFRLIDPGHYAPDPRAVVVPITFDHGLAVASGAITTPDGAALDCRLVIDTGVRATVILFHPFVVERRLLASQPTLLAGTIGGGAGGETIGDIGRLASLRIGGMSFDRPTAIFSRDTVGVFAGHDQDGIIGGELLRRCKVTFDYPHRRLILEPYAARPAAFEYDMSGLFLVARGDDFQELVIQSVAAGTPAADAGLKRGDRIVAIDGRGGAALALERVRELFRKPGVHQVDVARGGERLSVRLTTRRLV